MKYLGIDYGHKRIGIALSDDSGILATPFCVIDSADALEKVTAIVQEYSIGMMVIGESVNSDGEHNPIHSEATQFIGTIGQRTDVPHVFSKEFFSSVVARGNVGKESLHARQEKKPISEHVDAKAAAVILQRYLDSLPK